VARPNPAAASILLNSIQDTIVASASEENRNKYRFVTCLTLIEKESLRPEEYQELTRAFENYEKFKVDRIASMSRYAISDPRTQAEIDEEALIASKIKQSYKQVLTVTHLLTHSPNHLLTHSGEAASTEEASKE